MLTWRAAPRGTSGCVPPSAWRQAGEEPRQNVTAPSRAAEGQQAPAARCVTSAVRLFRRSEGRCLLWPRPPSFPPEALILLGPSEGML